MKEKLFFIKYGEFYLDDLDLTTTAYKTEFIRYFVLKINANCDSYRIEHANLIIDKLSSLGFNKDLFNLEINKYEDEEYEAEENDNN